MELKYLFRSFVGVSIHSSNRTFMELKFLVQKLNVIVLAVLIVPLWN